MGIRVGFCLLVLGLLAPPAQASCRTELLNRLYNTIIAPITFQVRQWRRPEFKIVDVNTEHPRLRAVIPDYNDQKDIVYVFRGDGHASLYIGPAFWDTGRAETEIDITYNFYEDFQQAYPGVFVRVRVGAARVKAMLLAARERVYHPVGRMSCQHSQLYFLQMFGILLKGEPPLLGTSTYDRVTKSGFVSPEGKAFPQDVYVIRGANQKIVDAVKLNLIGHSWGPLSDALAKLGVTDERLAVLLKDRGLESEIPFWQDLRHGRVDWDEKNINRAADDLGKLEALLRSEFKSIFDRTFQNWHAVQMDPHQFFLTQEQI